MHRLKELIPQWMINNFKHLPTAVLANVVYNFPANELTIIGVTGTDGKTTTVNMIYKVLKDAGKKVSMVSTINANIAGKAYDTGFHVSSPDPFTVQNFAKQAKNNRDEILVLEVTSHALDQYRFWGIRFDVGVITNITHDHLDYHKTWANYFATKAKLIKNSKIAVLNYDEKHFEKLSKINPNAKLISFGSSEQADFNINSFPLNLKMLGDFNKLNALAASAVCTYLGVDKNIIKKSLDNFPNLSGRMQEIKNNKGIKIIIDFAATSNSLEQSLKTLRGFIKSGKLISLFGSAGQRDIKKRELMGEVSARLADITVVTAEDPRGELEEINKQIVKGATRMGAVMGKNLFVVEDRTEAIKFVIQSLAKKGDVIGLFGKGHESSMNIDGKHELPWSEEEVVKRALHG